MTQRTAYAEFELDLTQALREKLPPVMEALEPAPLTKANVLALPKAVQGVYMLLQGKRPTYVGKTDAQHGFQDRLYRHFQTLSARRNLDLSEIEFKAVRIMVFTTVNVEKTLIDHFLGKSKMAWQNSGFGSNDPGHNRENQEPSEFDKRYPINIDMPLDFIAKGSKTGLELAVELKDKLPYDFRYQTDTKDNGKSVKHTHGHKDLRETVVNIPRDGMSLRELLQQCLRPSLGDAWCATVFPGRVILYKERTTYKYAIEQL